MNKRRRAYKQYDPRFWRRKIYIQRVNKLLKEHGDEIMECFYEEAERIAKAFRMVKKATIHYEPKENENEID